VKEFKTLWKQTRAQCNKLSESLAAEIFYNTKLAWQPVAGSRLNLTCVTHSKTC